MPNYRRAGGSYFLPHAIHSANVPGFDDLSVKNVSDDDCVDIDRLSCDDSGVLAMRGDELIANRGDSYRGDLEAALCEVAHLLEEALKPGPAYIVTLKYYI